MTVFKFLRVILIDIRSSYNKIPRNIHVSGNLICSLFAKQTTDNMQKYS